MVNDKPVTQGEYVVTLDFGTAAFTGDARYLEVGYRAGTSTGTYTVQATRWPIMPVAYALSLRPGAIVRGAVSGASSLSIGHFELVAAHGIGRERRAWRRPPPRR